MKIFAREIVNSVIIARYAIHRHHKIIPFIHDFHIVATISGDTFPVSIAPVISKKKFISNMLKNKSIVSYYRQI